MIGFLILISIIDIKKRIIPDFIILPGMVLALYLNGWVAFWGIISGLLSVQMLNTLDITHSNGGDCKLIGMIGGFLGWQAAIMISLWACLIKKIVFLKDKIIPYAPLITLGTIIWMKL
jgi:prepilin signal peptidase PulO-like enzyme (type II secretory pathway)